MTATAISPPFPPPGPPELRLEPGESATLRLVRAEDGAAPDLATRVALTDHGERLEIRFDCDDPAPWATLRERDAPLWEEEVVEVFLAPGGATPLRYFELEVNPLGALFDAVVDSPHGDRREWKVDRSWSCADLAWSASLRDDGSGWSARLALPWNALASRSTDRALDVWRANFYRIDRPLRSRDARSEFSAWSPTLATPADFHRPARFGFLRRRL